MASSHACDPVVVGEAMIVAGLGCTKGSPVAAVLAALDAALQRHGRTREELHALATVAGKRNETGLLEAAEALNIALVVPEDALLRAANDRGLTSSAASLAATGLDSASEAAALAVCGPNSHLLAPRLVLDGVTCALATAGDRQ